MVRLFQAFVGITPATVIEKKSNLMWTHFLVESAPYLWTLVAIVFFLCAYYNLMFSKYTGLKRLQTLPLAQALVVNTGITILILFIFWVSFDYFRLHSFIYKWSFWDDIAISNLVYTYGLLVPAIAILVCMFVFFYINRPFDNITTREYKLCMGLVVVVGFFSQFLFLSYMWGCGLLSVSLEKSDPQLTECFYGTLDSRWVSFMWPAFFFSFVLECCLIALIFSPLFYTCASSTYKLSWRQQVGIQILKSLVISCFSFIIVIIFGGKLNQMAGSFIDVTFIVQYLVCVTSMFFGCYLISDNLNLKNQTFSVALLTLLLLPTASFLDIFVFIIEDIGKNGESGVMQYYKIYFG